MPKGSRPAASKEFAPDAPVTAETGEAPAPPAAAGSASGPVTVHVSPGGQVTIAVQPSAVAAVPGVALEDAMPKAFALPGFLGGGQQDPNQPGALDQVKESLKSALETLGQKFIEFATDITSLEVRTFVSERIEDVRPDGANGFEFAQQRAMTYINFDGDTEVVVPVDAGQIDEALWKIHLQTVEAAQAHRAAMLKTIGELVQGFIPSLK